MSTSPAATRWPGCTATATTVAGIGADSDPSSSGPVRRARRGAGSTTTISPSRNTHGRTPAARHTRDACPPALHQETPGTKRRDGHGRQTRNRRERDPTDPRVVGPERVTRARPADRAPRPPRPPGLRDGVAGLAQERGGFGLEEMRVEIAGDEARVREEPRAAAARWCGCRESGTGASAAGRAGARPRAFRRRRSAWPAASRSAPTPRRLRRRRSPRGRPASTARGRAPAVPPAAGNSARGSSAQIRTSMAWPRCASAACVHGSRPPAATSSCARTRSTPVTASVIGCSTCRRAFISRK